MSVEITLEEKQQVFVSHVACGDHFFVQLDTKEAYELTELSANIQSFVKSSGSNKITPEYGLKCYAHSVTDSTWYRALVMQVNGSKVTVFYVDYGNTEELPIDCLRAPEGRFFDSPYQSVCCTNANFVPSTSLSKLETTLTGFISDKELYCSFVSKSSSKPHPFLSFLPCYNVLLYRNATNEVTLAETLVKRNLGQLAICAESIEVGNKHCVCVTYVDSPGKFWVQLSNRSIALDEVMDELNDQQVLSSLEPLPQAAIGEGSACCSPFVDDGRYYRAEIVHVSKSLSKVKIWFGDYGNTVSVSVKDIYSLPAQFTRLPFCAVLCGLDGVLPVKQDKPDPKLGNIAWTAKASSSFSDLTLEQEFEAQFVSELSPEIYTVHLKDLKTECDVGQVLADDGIVQLSTPTVVSVKEAQDDFQYLSLEVGQKYNKIFITHVESPAVVWCQRPDFLSEFEALASRLLSEAPSFSPLVAPDVGLPCCVQYTLDQSWCRGSIESADQMSRLAQVLFVDFGNSEEVNLDSIKALPGDFFTLPAQAISFSMATITPRVGNSWSEEACDCFKQLVEDRELNCNVIQLDDDEYPSLLLLDPVQKDSDIGQELVHRGYAKCPLPKSQSRQSEQSDVKIVPSGMQSGVTSPRQAQPASLNYTRVSLQSGRSYEVGMCHVESLSEFYCKLLSNSVSLDELMEKIDTYCRSAKPLTTEPVVPGLPVLAMFSQDQGWYRAEVRKQTDQQEYSVKFVDYGNSEPVPKSNLRQITSEFVVLPTQAIQCSLYGVSGDDKLPADIVSSFTDMTLEETCTLCVKSISESSVVVADLKTIDKFTVTEQLINIGLLKQSTYTSGMPMNNHVVVPPPVVKVICPTSVVACNVDSPFRFHLQLIDNYDALQSLTDGIGEYYSSTASSSEERVVLQVGCFCAAQFSVDSLWYRARITDLSGDQVQVEFIDFGNSEVTTVKALRVLQPQFTTTPCLAVACSLDGLSETETSEEISQVFSDLVVDQDLTAEFPVSISTYDCAIPVRLTNKCESGKEADIVSILAAASNSKSIDHPLAPAVTPPLGTMVSCQVSFIVTCDEFYCQVTSEISKFAPFMDELYAFYADQDEGVILQSPTVGTYCAAPYTDESWYRGLITDLTPQGASVFYIDYGNTEVIPLADLRTLDSRFYDTPLQAIKCSLQESARYSADECTAVFQDSVLEKEVEVTFTKLSPKEAYKATVLINSSDVCQILDKSGFAVSQAETPALTSHQIKLDNIEPTCDTPLPCTVSFVTSCSEFYCQLDSSSDSFVALMNDLYTYYGEQAKGRPLNSPSVGSYCAAPYSDESWYRCMITAVAGQEVTLAYIDYGNTEVVSLDEVCQLEDVFCNLPVQGIKCSLSSVSETSPAECTTKLQETVLEKEAQVVFSKQLPDGSYASSLNFNGMDVAQILVDAGVAISNVVSNTTIAQLQCVKPVLCSPMPCTVTFIAEHGDFYCQLISNSTDFDSLMNDLYTYYGEQAKGRPLTSPSVGSYCASPYSDGSWYRCMITAVAGQEVTVAYIDYGNTEVVSLDEVCQLEDTFCNIPVQGIKCFLSKVSSSTWSEKDTLTFQESVLEQQVDVNFVRQKSDNSYEVTMIKDGVDIGSLFQKTPVVSSSHSLEQTAVIQTTTPVLKTPAQCTISFVASCEEFYCQLSSETPKFDALMNDLYVYYGEGGNGTPLPAPAVGSYCAAPFSDDGSWYRGVITDVNSDSATVFYMDYGNSGEVGFSDLRKLEPQFYELPIQALLCCLSSQFSNEEFTKTFQDAVLEQEPEATFVSHLPSGTYVTQIKVGGKDVKELLTQSGIVDQPASDVPSIIIPHVVPECGPSLKCAVSYVVNCGEFYCQLSSETSTFDSFMNKLYAYYEESGDGRQLTSPSIGSMCAVPFTDGSWYRGKVTALLQNEAQVLYVDYGNSEMIPLPRIKELEPQFCGLPIQALRCHLRDLPPNTTSWTDECLVKFQEMVLENEVHVTFETQQPNASYPITMLTSGKDVSQVFSEAGLAKLCTQTSPKGASSKTTSLRISPYPLNAGSTCDVIVTAVTSSSEFYCQVLDPEESLDSLMIEIGSSCEGLPANENDEWKERDFVLARFSEDEGWYRAKIQNISSENGDVKVYYIDYGNAEVLQTSELRKMSLEFSQLPSQAIKCSLEGSQYYTYNENSHDHWIDLLLNQEMKLKCVSVHSDGTCFVDLERKDDGIDIMAHAIKLNVVRPRIVDTTVLPSEDYIQPTHSLKDTDNVQINCLFPAEVSPDSFHDVIVQHIENPSLFYCQFGQFHINQLDTLMNIMQDLYTSADNSFLPVLETNCSKGSFLAAQYSEDDLWYRSLVKGVSSVGADVRFIDYGNTELVSFEKLRFLSKEFTKLPAQAIPCSLAEVTPNGLPGSNWSAEASDKFTELVSIGESSVGQVKSSEDMSRQIFEYDGKQTLAIILIDASNDSEIAVGDELIRLGLANIISEPTNAPPINTLVGSAREKLLSYSKFLDVSIGESCEMYISNIVSPALFWLQMPTADDVLAVLQGDLTAVYGEAQGIVLTNLQEGNACCAKFSEDGCWYRAVVTKVSPVAVTVCFVDYGNSETVAASEVFVLQPEFLTTPVQAIECSLASLPQNYPEGIVAKFSDLVTNKELLVSFKSMLKINKWEVALQDGDQDIANVLEPLCSPSTQKDNVEVPTKQAVQIPHPDIQIGVTYPVYISFSVSPSKFFCQLASDGSKLGTLMTEIASYYSEHQLEPTLEMGSYCVAQYADSDNCSFYRAKITAVKSSDSIDVNFIDYGNSDCVSVKKIFGLSPQFAVLPVQGISCSIVQDFEMEFSAEVLQQFFQYDLNQEFNVKIRAVHNNRFVVDLYDEQGSHINASLLGMITSPPVQPSTEKQTYPSLNYAVGASVDAYVSFTNSPTDFYCQPYELTAELDNMMNEIASLMTSSTQVPLTLSELTPGKVCLAKYSDDNEWYRALVRKVTSEGVSVLFVDYGNSEMTSFESIAELPQQFLSHSVQAIHCSFFEGLDRDIVWKTRHTNQFQELVSQSDDHLSVKITDVSSTGQYFVELSINGKTIDFPSEQQMEKVVVTKTAEVRDHITPETKIEPRSVGLRELSTMAIKGSATSSAPTESGSEIAETDTDNGSAGELLIRAPFKLSLAVQESLDVTVVYVQSPSLLYLQRADCQSEMDNLSEEIEQYCASFGESFSQPFHQGDYVLAKYSVDDAWYRAEVTRVDSEDGTTEVSFIDYGNVEIIPPEDLIMCPENLLELPAQGIPCSLSQVPRRDSWPFEYKEMIKSLVEDKVLRATVVLPASQGMRPTVKLEDVPTNMDLSQQVLIKLQDECEIGTNDVIAEMPEGEDLDEEDLPAELQSEADSEEAAVEQIADEVSPVQVVSVGRMLTERSFEIGSSHGVYVISCDSPHSFICQLTADCDSLGTVTSCLSGLTSSDKAEKSLYSIEKCPQKGEIVAAQFSENEEWYRARIENCDSEGMCEVAFLDYGNSEILALEKIRYLDDALFSYPALSVECFLNGVEALTVDGVFQKEAAEKLLELVADEEASIEVVSIDTAGHLGVILTATGGVNVGSALIESKLASPIVPTPETLVLSPTAASDLADETKSTLPLDSEEPIVVEASSGEDRETDHISVEEVKVEVPETDAQQLSSFELPSSDFASKALPISDGTDQMEKDQDDQTEKSKDIPEDTVDTRESVIASTVDQRVPDDEQSVNSTRTPSPLSEPCEVPTEATSEPLDQTVPGGLQKETETVSKCITSLPDSEDPGSPTSSISQSTLSADEYLAPNTNGNNNNDDYATSFPAQNLTAGTRYKVQVLSLSSPEEFACQMIERSDVLKQLTFELAEASPKLATIANPTSGLPVSVYVETSKEWCRAEIISMGLSLDIIKVYYVDTGFSDIVPRVRVKPLEKKLADLLPPQAVKCQLCVLCETDLNPNLVVTGDPWELAWPTSCTRHFTDLTNNKDGLYLEILTTNKDGSYDVKMIDCTSECEVDLRCALVDKLRVPTDMSVHSPPCSIEHEESFEEALAQSDLVEETDSKCVYEVSVGLESVTLRTQTPSLVPAAIDNCQSSTVDRKSEEASLEEAQLELSKQDTAVKEADCVNDRVKRLTEGLPCEVLPSDTLAAVPTLSTDDCVDAERSVSTGDNVVGHTNGVSVVSPCEGVESEACAVRKVGVSDASSTSDDKVDCEVSMAMS